MTGGTGGTARARRFARPAWQRRSLRILRTSCRNSGRGRSCVSAEARQGHEQCERRCLIGGALRDAGTLSWSGAPQPRNPDSAPATNPLTIISNDPFGLQRGTRANTRSGESGAVTCRSESARRRARCSAPERFSASSLRVRSASAASNRTAASVTSRAVMRRPVLPSIGIGDRLSRMCRRSGLQCPRFLPPCLGRRLRAAQSEREKARKRLRRASDAELAGERFRRANRLRRDVWRRPLSPLRSPARCETLSCCDWDRLTNRDPRAVESAARRRERARAEA